MDSLHSGKNSAPPDDMFSPLSFPFGWKPVGELDETKRKVASNQAILTMVRRMASLQNADGDCDGADEVEGCIADDEDNGGDGVCFDAGYVRMSMTVWCRLWLRCG